MQMQGMNEFRTEQHSCIFLSVIQNPESYRVKHEAVHALTSGDDQHSGTTIESITSCHNVSPRLQSILLRWLIICGLWSKIYVKYHINNKMHFVSCSMKWKCTDRVLLLNSFNYYSNLINMQYHHSFLPFCRQQKWFQLRRDSQCLRSHPVDQSTQCIFPVDYEQEMSSLSIKKKTKIEGHMSHKENRQCCKMYKEMKWCVPAVLGPR